MRFLSGIAVTVFLLGLVPAECQSHQPVTKTLYLLQDEKNEQWCAFGDESEWKGEVNARSAMTVATVDYVNGSISAVSVTEQDEAGDWIVYDHYFFNESGAISKLKRTINVLPGDRGEDEVFLMAEGVARKQSIVIRKLSTGEPASTPSDWLPEVPIATRIEALPFFPLIGSQGLKAWPKGRYCIHTKS
jgi:hypothetical protein